MPRDGLATTDVELPLEPLFQGECIHALDAKGRLTIPVPYRPPLLEGMQIIRGEEQCLVVLTLPEWRRMWQEAARLPTVHGEVRQHNRRVFSAVRATLDSMGRILIPDHLRDFANIHGQAVIVGVNDKIEIWDPDLWQANVVQGQQNSDSIDDKTASLGLLR